jgi:hypothetical protein
MQGSPDPERVPTQGQDDDEPDVEGHKFAEPVERSRLNPEPEDAGEGDDEQGRAR